MQTPSKEVKQVEDYGRHIMIVDIYMAYTLVYVYRYSNTCYTNWGISCTNICICDMAPYIIPYYFVH